jgi:hypothetical protein
VGDLQRQHEVSLKEADRSASVAAIRGGGGAALAVAEPAVDQVFSPSSSRIHQFCLARRMYRFVHLIPQCITSLWHEQYTGGLAFLRSDTLCSSFSTRGAAAKIFFQIALAQHVVPLLLKTGSNFFFECPTIHDTVDIPQIGHPPDPDKPSL